MPKFGALAYLWISEWNDRTGAYALRQATAAGLDLIEIPMPNPGIFNAVFPGSISLLRSARYV